MRSQLDTDSSDSDTEDVSIPGLVGLSSDESDSDREDDTRFLSADSDSDHVSAHTYIPEYVSPIAEPPDCTTMPRLSYPDAYDSDSDSHPSLNSDSDSGSDDDDDHDSVNVPDDMPRLADFSDSDDDVGPDPSDVPDNMPHPADLSDDDDEYEPTGHAQYADDHNGSTDDDASDGSLSIPDLVSLSSDDYNSDSDSDDEAHFLAADDVSDDEDTPDYTPLERDIMSNTVAEVSLSTMHSSQDHTLAQYMITTAELVVDDVVFATGSCMLDTGALQASFISQELLDRHPSLYSRQRPCTVDVHLGDDAASTAVSVSTYVPISVRIPDADGSPHTAPVIWLLVMPTLVTDVIIGLPHLIKNFPHCFASHFMKAIMSTHETVSPSVSLSPLHVMHRSLQQSNTHPLNRPQPSLAPAGDRQVSVMSLNVNGFNAACSKGLIGYLEQRFDSHDVLLLQEVKLAPAKHAKASDAVTRQHITT